MAVKSRQKCFVLVIITQDFRKSSFTKKSLQNCHSAQENNLSL